MPIEDDLTFQREILLVDDDRDFRWATGNVLDAAGYRVIFAADGNEALGILEKNIPHLVLLGLSYAGNERGLRLLRRLNGGSQECPLL